MERRAEAAGRLLGVRAAAICTALACLGALAPAPGAGARVFAPGSPSVVLRQAESAFARRPTSAPKHDVSPLLRRLAAVLPNLHGAERARAAGLLARPTDGAADPQQNGWTTPEAAASPVCSPHFCVHWTASGRDAPNPADANHDGHPDWIDTVAATAENVYAAENGQLGWRGPKGDGSRGGGPSPNLTDIYLSDIGGSGIYGYAAPDQQGQGHSMFAYLVLDNDFSPQQFPSYASPVDPLDVTLAHEYNHVLQFNYDALEDTWMLESTAVWMEGKVYAGVHDYLQYLPGWAQLTLQPITSFDGNDSNNRTNVKVYGSSVWNKWLDQRYGQDIVRNAWEDSVAAGSFGPGAYAAALRQHGGPGFSDEFALFSAATAEWQAQNSGFPEGGLYPDVARVGALDVDGGVRRIALDHTTFALLNVPVAAAPRIKLAVVAPQGTSAALALVGRSGGSRGGTQIAELTRLPNGGAGAVTLTNPGNLTRLTAVLVNSDVRHGPYSNLLQNWRFTRDQQPFSAHASTDFVAPSVRLSGRQTLTATFSEAVMGVTRGSFSLVDGSGRRVRARVRLAPGATRATLSPTARLRRGRRYRVRLTSAITDLSLNPLPALTRSFTAR